jgi:hypothetical protein
LSPREGTFLILFGVGLGVFVGFFGLVADVGYAFSEKERTQAALDAAGFASLLTAAPTQSAMETSIREVLTASSVDPSVVTQVRLTSQGRGVNLRIEALVPTSASFSSLFGMSTFSTHVLSVTTGEIEYPQIPLSGFGLFACDELQVRNNIDSFDSRLGPYEGLPVSMPHAGTCSGGSNCGNNVLVGSNGDVVFKGANLWGAVATATGTVRKSGGGLDRVNRHVRVPGNASDSPNPIDSSVVVYGQKLYNAGFPPIDCRESVHFDDHLLDHDADSGHVHAGSGPASRRTFTSRRAIEDLDDGRGDMNFAYKGRLYSLGNRTKSPQSRMYLDSPKSGGKWGFNPCDAEEAGGFNLSLSGGGGGCQVSGAPLVLHTGFVYFFHEVVLTNSAVVEVTGDFETEGPAVIFVHGNAKDVGPSDQDLKGNGATFRYTGTCSGFPCPAGNQPPALAFLATDRSRLEMKGNFEIVADVLAPGAEIDLTGTSGTLGRIFGDLVSISSNAVDFNYDEALGDGDIEQYFRPRVRSVRIVE